MEFTKMHGLGNDFIIIENLDCSVKQMEDLAVRLCDRHTGIGADGVLVVEKSQLADIRMRIINSNGSEAEMCGNGIRCFARYVYDRGLINKNIMKIETLAGMMIAELLVDNNHVMSIKVDMGTPVFEKERIPFTGAEDNLQYRIFIGDKEYMASTIRMGVPHTVVYVDKIDLDEVVDMGCRIERLSNYPKGTNVNFVHVIDEDNLEVRTFERGAGFTLACGTGACASVVAAFKNNKVGKSVKVRLAIGSLNIEYDGIRVTMEGPGEYICEGVLL